jgi:LacI family transcriptional regulator, gluconate utilization system Gnt-I transcriptional repressor
MAKQGHDPDVVGGRAGRLSRRHSGRVTMREVAERAGVSKISVSRLLRNPVAVSQKLRARIETAIRELEYVPNRIAGGLASARTQMIPVIVPALTNAVFADIVQGVHDVLLSRGYQILLGNTNYSPDEEETLILALLGWFPEGIIVTGTHHSVNGRAILESSGIPVVEVMGLGDQPVDMNVGFSNFRAGFEMAEFLVERGYRRIAFVGALMDLDLRAAERRDGCRAALAERGLPPNLGRDCPGRSALRLGGEAIVRVLERTPEVDAVFFANDVLAVGAILECERRGVDVPGRVAIAGFNGLDIGAEVNPALTTIISPRYQMGYMAAEMLFTRLAGEEVENRIVDTGFEIVERQST